MNQTETNMLQSCEMSRQSLFCNPTDFVKFEPRLRWARLDLIPQSLEVRLCTKVISIRIRWYTAIQSNQILTTLGMLA